MKIKHIVIVVIVIGVFVFVAGTDSNFDEGQSLPDEYRNATYVIEGKEVTLVDGFSEVPAAPDSATMITTTYFGNDIVADLDGDGREDVAFILTQSTGGTGTFYYAVAAMNTEDGYVGSDGYLLGDRIAPQSVHMSTDEMHERVVVFNVADRDVDDAMTTAPSVGKSVYLKIVPESVQWAIVLSPGERESL